MTGLFVGGLQNPVNGLPRTSLIGRSFAGTASPTPLAFNSILGGFIKFFPLAMFYIVGIPVKVPTVPHVVTTNITTTSLPALIPLALI